MRQFDNNVSYFDNSGNILIGRVRFCNLDGTPATIYASDGITALENPIFTNSSGRLQHQVFLEDHDYLVYFDKYTGIIEMQEEDSDNSEVWEFQSSTINRYKTFDLKLDTEGIPSVGNISALRDLNPEVVKQESGTSYVQLLGYNEVGDKPSVNYYWDGNSSSQDNGGSIIKKSSTTPGAWILIPAFDYVDVRHFGAFPTETRSGDQNQQIKIGIAKDYAESLGLRTFFHANGTYIYYNVSGLIINRASSSDLARVYVKGSSTATFKNTESIFAYGDSVDDQGSISIYGDVLRTSFNSNNSYTVKLYPSSKLIFDTVASIRYGMNVEDVDCVFQVKQSSKITFTNCKFFGSKMLAKEVIFTFNNCEIRQDMFSDDSDYDFLEFTNCSSNPSLWTSPSKYVEFCEKNGTSVIDFNGIAFNAGIVLKAGVKIKNATFNSITSPQQAFPLDLELENVTLLYGAQGFFNNVKLYNSSISSINELNCVNFEAYNSIVINPVNCSKARLFNSTLLLDLQVKKCDIYNSVLDKGVVVNPSDSGNIEDVVVSGCTFGINSVIFFRLSAMCEASNVYVVNNILKGSSRPIVRISGYGFTSKTNYNVGGNVNSEVTRETSSATQSAFNTIITNGLLVNESAYLANVQKFRLAIYTTQSEIDRESEEGDIVVIYNNTDTNNKKFSRVVTGSGTEAIFSAYERKLAICKYGEAGHSNKWQTI